MTDPIMQSATALTADVSSGGTAGAVAVKVLDTALETAGDAVLKLLAGVGEKVDAKA